MTLKARLLAALECSTPEQRSSALGEAVSALLTTDERIETEAAAREATATPVDEAPAAACCDEQHADDN